MALVGLIALVGLVCLVVLVGLICLVVLVGLIGLIALVGLVGLVRLVALVASVGLIVFVSHFCTSVFTGRPAFTGRCQMNFFVQRLFCSFTPVLLAENRGIQKELVDSTMLFLMCGHLSISQRANTQIDGATGFVPCYTVNKEF